MLEPPTYTLAIFADSPALFIDGRAEVVLISERVAREVLEAKRGEKATLGSKVEALALSR